MTAEQVFSISNMLALLGWLLLVFAGRVRRVPTLITGVLIPLALALLYTALIVMHFGETKGSFGALDGVAALFSNRWLLLAGWVHYLAFDLFIGSWQVRDAMAHKISHLLVVPCLLVTFLFGPIGLLLYFGLRYWRLKSIALSIAVNPAIKLR